MVYLLGSTPHDEDVEMDVDFQDDGDGWCLSFDAENAAGDRVNNWHTSDFNEMRPFFRAMRAMCDKFYAIDGKTNSFPAEPAEPPAHRKGGAVLVELDGFSNSGPGGTVDGNA